MKKLILLVTLISGLSVNADPGKMIQKIDNNEVESLSCFQGGGHNYSFFFSQEDLSKGEYKVIFGLNSHQQVIMENDRIKLTCDNIKITYKTK